MHRGVEELLFKLRRVGWAEDGQSDRHDSEDHPFVEDLTRQPRGIHDPRNSEENPFGDVKPPSANASISDPFGSDDSADDPFAPDGDGEDLFSGTEDNDDPLSIEDDPFE